MKINENDIRMMNRMMAAEMLLKEAMVGSEDENRNSLPEQVTLYSLIHEMSGLLRDATVIMKEIGDLVKKYEDNDWEDAGDEDESCDGCPCYDICWIDETGESDDDDEAPFMVMIAVPGHGFSVMKDSKAEYDYPELFPNGNGSKDLTPVPGIEDVYYTFSSQSKRSANGKTYVSSPVMIMKIDEDAGDFISPDAMDLYKAAEYFSERSGEIRMSDGRVIPAFCLD